MKYIYIHINKINGRFIILSITWLILYDIDYLFYINKGYFFILI